MWSRKIISALYLDDVHPPSDKFSASFISNWTNHIQQVLFIIVMTSRGRTRHVRRERESGSSDTDEYTPKEELDDSVSSEASITSESDTQDRRPVRRNDSKAHRLKFLAQAEIMRGAANDSDSEADSTSGTRLRNVKRTSAQGWKKHSKVVTNQLWKWFDKTVSTGDVLYCSSHLLTSRH